MTAQAIGIPSHHRLIESAKGLLVDWDGCLALGDTVLPGAARFLKRYGQRTVIISNNSTALPQDFVARLSEAGVNFPEDRIVLAGVETLHHARNRGFGRVMILADRRIKTHARALGLEPVRERPEAVLLMRHTRLTFAALQEAANAVRNGIPLIVSNTDHTHPAPDGGIVPETGALLAVLRACAPQIRPEIIGKPQPLMFLRGCGILGIAPDKAVMIGDNPETDIKGARALGLGTILVGGHAL